MFIFKLVTPKEFVDNVSNEIKDIWDIMNTSYDKFVRTTDPHHEKIVQHIFKYMYDKGDIYKGEYRGLYCTPCESFWTESQLVDGKCPDCGREVEEKCEEAYFFKLSKYQDRLEKYINEHPDFIQPESRRNEMINNFIKPGLQDLCVSRTSFSWGIPVDFDPKHVVYVWLDALTNYITNIGYDVDSTTDQFKKLWPADLHLIGKDIIRFHTIYWPCFLMSLDLPLPKKVFGHDAVRYYFLHEIPFASDGVFTRELLIERINGDLANILGNLVQRTISMGNKYFDGKVVNKGVYEDVDKVFINNINELEKKVTAKMDKLQVCDAISEIFNVLRLSNKYIDDTTPWVLAKNEELNDRLSTVIYNLLEAIRVAAVFLSPFLPETSEKIYSQLNNSKKDFNYLKDNSYNLGKPSPLFMRIDTSK